MEPSERGESMFVSLSKYVMIRWLWTGTVATNTGFWMYQVALGWLALEMTDSAFWVGLASFFGGIPLLIFAMPAGVIVDRFDRRKVLMFGQAGTMITATIFSIMIFAGALDRISMLALAALYGSSMAFVFPVRHAIIARLVEPQDLANATALNSAGQNACRVFGPSLAGLLIALVGLGGTFAVAAGLQIFALASSLKLPSTPPRNPGKRPPPTQALTEGIRYVARVPELAGTILLATIGTVLIMPYLSLMPVFARDVLNLGASGLGGLMTGVGIGSVIGALVIAGIARLIDTPGVQLLMIISWVVTVLAFAITPWLLPAALLLFVSGLLSAMFLATNQTILQLKADDEIRGRVLAVNQITWGLLPLGQLPIGLLAEDVGAPMATVVACILALVGISVTAVRVPILRTARPRTSTTN